MNEVLERGDEIDRGPFSAHALQARRRADALGHPLRIVPGWMGWSIWVIVGATLAAIVFAVAVELPDYGRGPAVIRMDGHRVIVSRTAGTVVELAVRPGQRVEAGAALIRFDSSVQAAELERVEREHEAALARLLRDPADDSARTELARLGPELELARARLDERTVRADAPGIVADVRVRAGHHVDPGHALLTVDRPDSTIVLVALLPGHVRPRLMHPGASAWFAIDGFPRHRVEVGLRSVADGVVGPVEALRYLGDDRTGAIELRGPVVIAEALVPGREFEVEGRTYRFYDGMQGELEIELERRSLLRSALPMFDAFTSEAR